MGYLFLAIALFAGTAKGYCGKRAGNTTTEIKDAVSVNILRMLFCTVIGLALLMIQGQLDLFGIGIIPFSIMAASGVFTALFVFTWLVSVKHSAYLLIEISLMMGILVPIIASAFLYGESIGISEWIGILFLILATCVMASYNSEQKKKITPSSILLLVLCGLCYGLTDLSQKMFVKSAPALSVSVFNFYTYVFAFFTLLILLFCFGERTVKSAKASMGRAVTSSAVYILIMAVCLFANSYFKTLAARYLDAAQLYPLSQGASLILSSLMAAACFGEKLTKKCVLGIVLAFTGLLMINVFKF